MFACTISKPKFPQIYSFTNPKKTNYCKHQSKKYIWGIAIYAKRKDACKKKLVGKYLQHTA